MKNIESAPPPLLYPENLLPGPTKCVKCCRLTTTYLDLFFQNTFLMWNMTSVFIFKVNFNQEMLWSPTSHGGSRSESLGRGVLKWTPQPGPLLNTFTHWSASTVPAFRHPQLPFSFPEKLLVCKNTRMSDCSRSRVVVFKPAEKHQKVYLLRQDIEIL